MTSPGESLGKGESFFLEKEIQGMKGIVRSSPVLALKVEGAPRQVTHVAVGAGAALVNTQQGNGTSRL